MSPPAQSPTQPAPPSQITSSDYAGRFVADESEVANNASKLCQDRVKFNKWASSVQLDPTIRDKDLPEPLQTLLRDSWTVPRWVLGEVILTCPRELLLDKYFIDRKRHNTNTAHPHSEV